MKLLRHRYLDLHSALDPCLVLLIDAFIFITFPTFILPDISPSSSPSMPSFGPSFSHWFSLSCLVFRPSFGTFISLGSLPCSRADCLHFWWSQTFNNHQRWWCWWWDRWWFPRQGSMNQAESGRPSSSPSSCPELRPEGLHLWAFSR